MCGHLNWGLGFSKHETVCNLMTSASCAVREHVDWELDASYGLALGRHEVVCDPKVEVVHVYQ